jgi:hypothetical protein
MVTTPGSVMTAYLTRYGTGTALAFFTIENTILTIR